MAKKGALSSSKVQSTSLPSATHSGLTATIQPAPVSTLPTQTSPPRPAAPLFGPSSVSPSILAPAGQTKNQPVTKSPTQPVSPTTATTIELSNPPSKPQQQSPAKPITPAIKAAPRKVPEPRHWSPPPTALDHPMEGIQTSDEDNLKEYTKHRRDLLETLNSLHSTGIQNDLDLPQIVVIGSQSVGKSSLIESMSGLTLPREAGTCTRCPMECRLQYAPVWSCKVVLRFQYDLKGHPVSNVQEQGFGPTMFDRSLVEGRIRRAQLAILHPSLDPSIFLDEKGDLPEVRSAPTLSFSPNCVCIRVAGPNVPDLYFYDLPGIIANVRDGGNEADISAVKDIARDYIRRPNCFVLLVISCETDFENQGAGRLVLKDKDLRSRTIGVLTKTDRIEPGTASKWIDMLKNTENTLEHGWFAVKQPTQHEHATGVSWEEARFSENEFFTSADPWASLEQRYSVRMGSAKLAENLSVTLSHLVSQKLPQIQAEIARLLSKTNKELDALPIANYGDPCREVVTLIRDFTKSVAKHIDGAPPPHFEPHPSKLGLSLIHRINTSYNNFRSQVHRTAPIFRPWNYSYHKGKESAPVTSPETQTDYQKMKASAAQGDAQDGSGFILYSDQVMELAKRSRTRELPGNFPFSVKENLIKEATKDWKGLAQECFSEVKSIVHEHLSDILQEHLGKYAHGGLMADVGTVLSRLLEERAHTTAINLELACLNEATPFTQNEHYFFAYRSKLLSRYRMLFRASCGQSGLVESLEHYNTSGFGLSARGETFWDDINTILSMLSKRGIHGVVASDLAKLLPNDDIDPALEIMAEVRAYFQVAYKRFSDVIPQQIDADFLRNCVSSLDIQLMCMDLSRERCIKWLEESPEHSVKRGELMAKKRRLESAKEKLGSHFHAHEGTSG